MIARPAILVGAVIVGALTAALGVLQAGWWWVSGNVQELRNPGARGAGGREFASMWLGIGVMSLGVFVIVVGIVGLVRVSRRKRLA